MRPVGEVLGIRQLQAAEPLDLLGRLKLAIQVAGTLIHHETVPDLAEEIGDNCLLVHTVTPLYL